MAEGIASPQLEDGFTPIANEIVEALMKINLSAYESRVLWFIFRKTYGFKKKTDWIALSQFSKAINLDRRLVHRALKKLSSKKMIVIYRDDKFRIRYGFQKNYNRWRVSSKEMTRVIYRDDQVSSKEIPTKETIQKKRKICAKDKEFEVFYKAYPNKKAKESALKMWKKRKEERPPIEDLLKIISLLKETDDWKTNGGQFIPYPATWLNGKRWEDEIKSEEETITRCRNCGTKDWVSLNDREICEKCREE